MVGVGGELCRLKVMRSMGIKCTLCHKTKPHVFVPFVYTHKNEHAVYRTVDTILDGSF